MNDIDRYSTFNTLNIPLHHAQLNLNLAISQRTPGVPVLFCIYEYPLLSNQGAGSTVSALGRPPDIFSGR